MLVSRAPRASAVRLTEPQDRPRTGHPDLGTPPPPHFPLSPASTPVSLRCVRASFFFREETKKKISTESKISHVYFPKFHKAHDLRFQTAHRERAGRMTSVVTGDNSDKAGATQKTIIKTNNNQMGGARGARRREAAPPTGFGRPTLQLALGSRPKGGARGGRPTPPLGSTGPWEDGAARRDPRCWAALASRGPGHTACLSPPPSAAGASIVLGPPRSSP